jgi:hypothetical protein
MLVSETETVNFQHSITQKIFLGHKPTPELVAILLVYFVQGILGLARLAVSFFLKDDLALDGEASVWLCFRWVTNLRLPPPSLPNLGGPFGGSFVGDLSHDRPYSLGRNPRDRSRVVIRRAE